MEDTVRFCSNVLLVLSVLFFPFSEQTPTTPKLDAPRLVQRYGLLQPDSALFENFQEPDFTQTPLFLPMLKSYCIVEPPQI